MLPNIKSLGIFSNVLQLDFVEYKINEEVVFKTLGGFNSTSAGLRNIMLTSLYNMHCELYAAK